MCPALWSSSLVGLVTTSLVYRQQKNQTPGNVNHFPRSRSKSTKKIEKAWLCRYIISLACPWYAATVFFALLFFARYKVIRKNENCNMETNEHCNFSYTLFCLRVLPLLFWGLPSSRRGCPRPRPIEFRTGQPASKKRNEPSGAPRFQKRELCDLRRRLLLVHGKRI